MFLSLAFLQAYLAGSTPKVLIPFFEKISKKDPSLEPISKTDSILYLFINSFASTSKLSINPDVILVVYRNDSAVNSFYFLI